MKVSSDKYVRNGRKINMEANFKEAKLMELQITKGSNCCPLIECQVYKLISQELTTFQRGLFFVDFFAVVFLAVVFFVAFFLVDFFLVFFFVLGLETFTLSFFFRERCWPTAAFLMESTLFRGLFLQIELF
ncbi:MAG: hypothetical protein R2827_16390 [Bdellovibrionales bacterium]